jgi:hypothetical protein
MYNFFPFSARCWEIRVCVRKWWKSTLWKETFLSLDITFSPSLSLHCLLALVHTFLLFSYSLTDFNLYLDRKIDISNFYCCFLSHLHHHTLSRSCMCVNVKSLNYSFLFHFIWQAGKNYDDVRIKKKYFINLWKWRFFSTERSNIIKELYRIFFIIMYDIYRKEGRMAE